MPAACGKPTSGYLWKMSGLQPTQEEREFTIPEGCPVCAADLPVRVTASGAMSACRHCRWIGRPTLTVTHQGLKVSVAPATA